MEDKFRKILESEFNNIEQLKVNVSEGDCGIGLKIFLVSKEFENTLILKRHRRVQNLFMENSDYKIHKITIRALTPIEASNLPAE